MLYSNKVIIGHEDKRTFILERSCPVVVYLILNVECRFSHLKANAQGVGKKIIDHVMTANRIDVIDLLNAIEDSSGKGIQAANQLVRWYEHLRGYCTSGPYF